jgi:hypothetical protein
MSSFSLPFCPVEFLFHRFRAHFQMFLFFIIFIIFSLFIFQVPPLCVLTLACSRNFLSFLFSYPSPSPCNFLLRLPPDWFGVSAFGRYLTNPHFHVFLVVGEIPIIFLLFTLSYQQKQPCHTVNVSLKIGFLTRRASRKYHRALSSCDMYVYNSWYSFTNEETRCICDHFPKIKFR